MVLFFQKGIKLYKEEKMIYAVYGDGAIDKSRVLEPFVRFRSVIWKTNNARDSMCVSSVA